MRTLRFPAAWRRRARLGATWGLGMLMALAGAACQAPRAANPVPGAPPSALAATATAVPPATAPTPPTLTPATEGGSGGVRTVVLVEATPTLAPGMHRVLLTVPTIA